jgi:8-oxo-dGTP pyrophosphatase MutT (NUDIX family)
VKSKERSAGIVVVRRAEAGWRYLVLRCFKNWDFPKGRIEAAETPLEAARREVTEETSLADVALPWGEAFLDTEPYAGGKIARYYLGESPTGDVHLPFSPELGRPEHHEHRWVTVDEARRLLPPRLQPILAWAAALIENTR